MNIYSYSKLKCYEQCPQKFKFQYIDKIRPEFKESVELFLGKRVHETLKKLYWDLRYQKEIPLADLLFFLHNQWAKTWNDSITIVKEGYRQKDYLNMAEKYITNYYNRYKPFNHERTISLEEHFLINLDKYGKYKLCGYIDRFTEAENGCYTIHDYKTCSRLPSLEDTKKDRQLALYAIGIKERYPDVKDVRLVWHFLAFDKEIDSTKTDEELEELKQNTIQLIDRIESEEKYPTNSSKLCDWCEYKTICKEWSHLYKLEGKPANEYLNDDGVKLVNRYAELQNKKKQIKLDLYAEIEKLEEAIIKFSEKEGVDVVFGSNNKVKVKSSERYACPAKHSKEREKLEQILREKGKWDEVAQLDTNAINKIIQDNKWDNELIDTLKDYVNYEESKRLYISKLKKMMNMT